MTREQIIAGLECLSHHICPDCPNYGEKEKCPDGEVKTVEIARAALEYIAELEAQND